MRLRLVHTKNQRAVALLDSCNSEPVHVLSFSTHLTPIDKTFDTVSRDGGFPFFSRLLKALLIPAGLNMERNVVCCCPLVKTRERQFVGQ